jgi:hypothetical protein
MSEGFTKVSEGGSYGYRWRSPRWQCNVCRRTGYGIDDQPYTWSAACRNGHAPCPWCDQQLALRKDGTPRVHTRCPERPDDAELLRLIAMEVRQVARLGVRGPLHRDATALLDRLTRPDETTP